VTNLRLPGQYDERLLGSLGLQGPYYNWNRWYLPGVGRYLELDPIALEGMMNTEYGPDWYNYALGNPLSYYDADGRNAGVLAGFACGPPCAVAGFVAVAAATAVVAKVAADATTQCRKKDGACSCVCYQRGIGPNAIGQKPNANACKDACNSMGYSGYKCGGDVTWD